SSPRMRTSFGVVMRIVIELSCWPDTKSRVFQQPARPEHGAGDTWGDDDRRSRSQVAGDCSRGVRSPAAHRRDPRSAALGRELGFARARLADAGDRKRIPHLDRRDGPDPSDVVSGDPPLSRGTGRVTEASFEVVIGQEHVRTFAELSGDWNPLHTDAAYAATTQYGRPILHGAFSAGLVSRMAGMHIPGTDCLLH